MVFRNPWFRHILALSILLSIVLSLLLPYRDIPLAIDSSIFAAVGLHLNHGSVLYRDAWDHKPPLVFFLNALALRVGGETHTAIRDLQTLFGCLNLLAFYFLTWTLFRSISTSFCCSILFLFAFYHPMIYGGGNFTEEYGAFFVLLGVLGIARWVLLRKRRSRLPLFFAGCGFGAAALTKEPFVFSFVPWFVYTLLFSRGGWIESLKNSITLLSGCFFVGLFPLFYFMKHHAFMSWVEVIQYGVQYTQRFSDETILENQSEGLFRVSELIFSNSTLLVLLFVLGVASLSRSGYLRRTRYIQLFALYWVIFDFFATSLSGMFFLHYYLQMVAPILLVSAGGVYFLIRWAAREPLNVRWAVGSVFLFCALIDFTIPGMLAVNPPLPVNRARDPVLDFLHENQREGDTLWASNGYMARYYLETGMLSPTRYLAVFPHHLQKGSSSRFDRKKLDAIYKDLTESPPDFIVGSELLYYPFYRKEFFEWFQTRYSVTPIGEEERVTLVFQKVSDPTDSLAGQKKDWVSNETQSEKDTPFYQREILKLLQGSAPQWF